MFESLAMAGVLAIFAPLVAMGIGEPVMNSIRKKRALKRFDGDPYIELGARVAALHEVGIEKPIMTNCFISRMEKGLVVFESMTSDKAITFTVQEAEALNPVIMLQPGNNLRPLLVGAKGE